MLRTAARHALGITIGAMIFLAAYALKGNSEEPPTVGSPDPEIAVDLKDTFNLTRLSFTEALEPGVSTLWVYDLAEVCAREREIAADEFEFELASVKEGPAKLKEITLLRRLNTHKGLSAACKSGSPYRTPFFLTSSHDIYSDLSSKGVRPRMVALGK